MRSMILGAAALAAIASPYSALAQNALPDGIQAKMESVAELSGFLSTCGPLGYKTDVAAITPLAKAITEEAVAKGATQAAVDAAGSAMVGRAATKLRADMAAVEGAKTREAFMAALTRFVAEQAPLCAKAAADPRLSTIITSPPGHNVAAARKAMVDEMMAAWKAPQWISNGNLVYTVGACSRQLDAKTVAAISAPYLAEARKAPVPSEEQAYYLGAFDAGVKKGAETPPEAQLCKALSQLPAKPAP